MSNPRDPLLGRQTFSSMTNQEKLKYALENGFLVIKGALAINGTFVLFFYPGPAASCVEAANCGKWFADLVGKEVAIGVYIAGGLGFVATNSYFSFASLDAFVDYIKRQPTFLQKLLKGGFVVGFTASQVAPALFASMQTATSPLITILSVAGVIPGALFGGVDFTQTKISATISHGRSELSRLSYSIRNVQHPKKEILIMHNEFNQKLNANWNYLMQHYGEYDYDASGSELDLLFKHAGAIYRENPSEQALNAIKLLIILALTTFMTAPFLMPTVAMFDSLGVPTYGSYAITGFFNISAVIGNHKFVKKAISGVSDTASKKAQGGKIPSVDFALHPYASTVALTACFLLSVLSYCYADTIYQKNFPGEDTGLRLVGRVGADVAINIYHFAGFFAVYQMASRGFTNFTTTHIFAKLASCIPPLNGLRNPTNELFFKAEEKKNKLLSMTFEEFEKFYNENQNNELIFPEKINDAAQEPDEESTRVHVRKKSFF